MSGPPRLLELRDGLLVVDKRPGLPSTGRTLDDPDCLQSALMRLLRRRKVWAVHQLDRDTSGLNLFCTRKALVAAWAARLSAGTKTYLALCHGALVGAPRTVDLAIGRRRGPSGRELPALRSDGKPARSTITPRAASADGRVSLVEVVIHTGRTHQVRLHLASLGHPLLGERLHRDPPCELLPRHGLHAWRLDLGPDARWEAPLPPDLAYAIEALGVS